MKILTIVGARPQFVKAAMVSRAIACHNEAINNQQSTINDQQPAITEIIVHTGQHYDQNMSQIFFDQMHIPRPKYNLGVGSGRHGETTGRMLAYIEGVLYDETPDWVLVYGDTNSTLAGALAAAKLHVPVAHVEAGLRSFNRRMPEEINRVLTDHVSSLLFCPTQAAIDNLQKEGFPPPTPIAHRPFPIAPSVFHVGDVMYDAALVFAEIAAAKSNILSDLGLTPGEYLLATVHRPENTDDPARMKSIMSAFIGMAQKGTVVFPIHPRTRAKLDGIIQNPKSKIQNLIIIPPVSFLDMVQLEKNARCILTDSGGVQKEAYLHGVPCVTLRDETEWVETVSAGWNQVVGVDADRICKAVDLAATGRPIPDYGNGHASEYILNVMVGFTG